MKTILLFGVFVSAVLALSYSIACDIRPAPKLETTAKTIELPRCSRPSHWPPVAIGWEQFPDEVTCRPVATREINGYLNVDGGAVPNFVPTGGVHWECGPR